MVILPDDTRLQNARKRVRALKGFYTHVVVFLFVMSFLFLINARGGGDWWAIWPLLGWGFGVVIHAIAVFLKSSSSVEAWEERKIRQFLDR